MAQKTATDSSTGTKTLGSYIVISKDPAQKVREAYDIAKKATTLRREQWREVYLNYHGYIQDKFKNYKRANFHFHKIFPQIELESARFITGYFTHKPFVAAEPFGGNKSNINNIERAKLHEAAIQHYYEHCPNFYLSTLRHVKNTLLYGSSFRVLTWRTIKQKVMRKVPFVLNGQPLPGIGVEKEIEETVYDGLWFDNYSPSEVFPDPFGNSIDNCRYVIIEQWIDADDLMQRAKNGAYDVGRVSQIPMNMSGQQDIEYEMRAAEMGYEHPTNDEGIVRLQHYFADNHFITLANDETVIRDVDNPLDHKKKPISHGMKTIDPDSFWPIGSARPILADQKLVNLFVNMMADNVITSAFPIWKHKADIDPNYLISVPNQHIPVDSMDDVDIVKMPEMKHDIVALKLMVEQHIEEISGYFGPQKGYSPTKHTATSDVLFAQQGDKRVNYDVMTFENCTLLPESKQVAKLIEQFMPEEIQLNMASSGGRNFVKLTPEEFRGEYIYKVSGISTAINRALQRQQLLELVKMGAGMEQFVRLPNGMVAPVPLQDNRYALRSAFEAFDRQDAEKMLIPPEVFGEPLNNDLLSATPTPAIPYQDQLHKNPKSGALRNTPWGQQEGNPARIEQAAMHRGEFGVG